MKAALCQARRSAKAIAGAVAAAVVSWAAQKGLPLPVDAVAVIVAGVIVWAIPNRECEEA